MRLEQLAYAEAALRLGSLRKAAQELGVAQPSLSQQVQRLEEELGVVLLIRRPSGVRSTDAAVSLLPHIRTALRADENMRQEASAISGLRDGRVRLGSIATASRTLLPKVVRRFQREYPRIHFQVTEGGSEIIADLVTRGEIDLGIISRFADDVEDPGSLAVENLALARLAVCVPSGHRLADREQIVAADMAGEPMVVFPPGYILRRAFDRLAQGRDLAPVFYTENNETARHLVSAGVGLAVASRLGLGEDEAVHRGRIRFVPLAEPWAWTRMSTARRPEEQPTPAVRALVRMLRTEARAARFHECGAR